MTHEQNTDELIGMYSRCTCMCGFEKKPVNKYGAFKPCLWFSSESLCSLSCAPSFSVTFSKSLFILNSYFGALKYGTSIMRKKKRNGYSSKNCTDIDWLNSYQEFDQQETGAIAGWETYPTILSLMPPNYPVKKQRDVTRACTSINICLKWGI